MNPDPYGELARAYQRLAVRRLAWIGEPSFVNHGGLDGIVAAVRADHPDASASDRLVRRLASIGHEEESAMVVLLYALADELRFRLGRAFTAEYRSDALTDLATVVLEGDLAGPRIGHRLVNRAHTRTHKHHHRIRHRGYIEETTVDPYPPEWVIEAGDRRGVGADVADLAAARVDIARFHEAIMELLSSGVLPLAAWEVYRDHRLRSVFVLPAPAPTERRVAAYRVAQKLQPLVDSHLRGHAA